MFYLIIYLVLLFLTFIIFISQKNTNSKLNSLCFGLVFLLFLLVAGFRFETGFDWESYGNIFDSVLPIQQIYKPNFFSIAGQEPLYTILNSLVKTFGGGIQSVFFISACISLFFFKKGIEKLSNNLLLSSLLFFCYLYLFLCFSVIRQGLAVSICFYAWQFIPTKQYLKYFPLIFLAMGFHFTAIIMLPLYFILNLKIHKYFISAVIIFGLGLCFFRIQWIAYFLSISSKIINNTWYTEKIISYPSNLTQRAFSPMMIVDSLILLFLVCNIDKLKKNNIYASSIIKLFFALLISRIYLYEIQALSLRLEYYFLPSVIILSTYVVSIFEKKERIIILSLWCTLGFLSSRSVFLESPQECIYNPYQNLLYYKIKNIKSTGKERTNKYIENYHLKNVESR